MYGKMEEFALDCGIWEREIGEPMARNLAVMPKSQSNCDCVGVQNCVVHASILALLNLSRVDAEVIGRKECGGYAGIPGANFG